MLNVESVREHAFTRTQEQLLWSLAQHAATAIEKLRFDEMLTKLREVENLMGRLESFDDTAQAILHAVNDPLGYDFVNMSLVNTEKRRIKTGTFWESPKTARKSSNARPTICSTATTSRRTSSGRGSLRCRRSSSRQAQLSLDDPDIYEQFGHERLIRVFVPMRLPQANRVVGTIEAGYNQTYRRFIYERDVKMLQGFADYAALALDQRISSISISSSPRC